MQECASGSVTKPKPAAVSLLWTSCSTTVMLMGLVTRSMVYWCTVGDLRDATLTLEQVVL
jgi:hypothetical protein